MFINEIAILVASMIIPFSFVFSIYFKAWKVCPMGVVMVGIFSLILGLKSFDVIPGEYWIATHLFLISIISLLVMLFVVFKNFKNYCETKKL